MVCEWSDFPVNLKSIFSGKGARRKRDKAVGEKRLPSAEKGKDGRSNGGSGGRHGEAQTGRGRRARSEGTAQGSSLA